MADRCKRCTRFLDSEWGGSNTPQVGNGGELTAILGPNFNDADLVVSGSVSDFTNSQLGIVLRWTDDNNYYKAFINGANLTILRRQGRNAPMQSIP